MKWVSNTLLVLSVLAAQGAVAAESIPVYMGYNPGWAFGQSAHIGEPGMEQTPPGRILDDVVIQSITSITPAHVNFDDRYHKMSWAELLVEADILVPNAEPSGQIFVRVFNKRGTSNTATMTLEGIPIPLTRVLIFPRYMIKPTHIAIQRLLTPGRRPTGKNEGFTHHHVTFSIPIVNGIDRRALIGPYDQYLIIDLEPKKSVARRIATGSQNQEYLKVSVDQSRNLISITRLVRPCAELIKQIKKGAPIDH